jgi:hypothetical protein
MPRTVILANGRKINNVPDDVSDEELSEIYKVEKQDEEVAEVSQPVIETEEEDDKSFLESAKEVGTDLQRVAARTATSLVKPFVSKMLPDDLTEEQQEAAETMMSSAVGSTLAGDTSGKLIDPETGKIAATETVPGMVAEIVPYVAVGSKVQAAKTIQALPRVVQGLATGVITDQLLADPEENVFNVIQDLFPESTVADYTAFMAADEEDSEIVQRLKLVGEGLGLGLLGEVLVGGGKGAITLAKKSREMFKKSYTDLSPEEQGEIFVDFLKDTKETAGLKNREDKIEFNETPEGAAQVRQQQSSGLNRFFRQVFTSRGYFTPKAQSAFDDAEYAQRAAVSRAEHISRRLTTAIDEVIKTTDDSTITERVQEALSSERLKNVMQPDRKTTLMDIQDEFGFTSDVAEEVLNARQLIDDLSRDITGSSILPLKVKELVNENVGSYMRRSYKLFEDTGYTPADDVLNDAKEYIANQKLLKDPNMSELKAYEEANDVVDDILDQGGFSDRSAAGDYFVKVKRINKEILEGKKEIAPEIRALMGEIEDPADNIVLTVSKMARFAETSKFYNNLDRLGQQGDYILDKSAKRPRDFVKITGTNSKLDGKYTTPEIFTAIKNKESNLGLTEGEGFLANGYRNFLALKGGSQAAKTVYSVTTHARNLLGAVQFGSANGLNPFANIGATGKVLLNQIARAGDTNLDEAYEKYQRLGIINTNVKVGEFRALMDSDYDVMLNPDKLSKKLGKGYGRAVDGIQDLYVATDDMFKVNAYHQELDTLKRAFPNYTTDKQIAILEEKAAETIRNTFPNYDRVPKGIKALRELPVGSFVSFPAEILRTSGNIVRQSIKEIGSGSDVLAARGRARLAGFAATNSVWAAAGATSAKLAGFNDDQRKSIEDLTTTPWSKDAPKLFLKIDDEIYTADTQFLDSYSVIKEPLLAAYREINEGRLQGESADKYIRDAMLGSAQVLLKPFVDETILTKSLTDVAYAYQSGNGRTPEGKPIFTPGLSNAEKGIGALQHVLSSWVPGAAIQAKNIFEGIAEVPNKYTGNTRPTTAEVAATFLGVRFTPVDAKNILGFAAGDYTRANTNLVGISADYRTKGEKIVNQYVNKEKERYRNAQEFYTKVQASVEVVGRAKTAKFLKDSGMSSKAAGRFLAGKYFPEKVSTDLIRGVIEKTPLGPDETASSIARDLNIKRASMIGTHLNNPDKDSILRRGMFAIGGEVTDVPQAPEEPDERIDRMTGMPYNLQAGGAFIDEEEREAFGAGGAVVKAIANVIKQYSKKGVSEENALQAAENIVKTADETKYLDPDASTDNPRYERFLRDEVRVLLDEKHTPIPQEILDQVDGNVNSPEFSRLRGYTDDEIKTFENTGTLAASLSKQPDLGDMQAMTSNITNELDNIKARDFVYDDEEAAQLYPKYVALNEQLDMNKVLKDEGIEEYAAEINNIKMEYADAINNADREGKDLAELLAEQDSRIKEVTSYYIKPSNDTIKTNLADEINKLSPEEKVMFEELNKDMPGNTRIEVDEISTARTAQEFVEDSAEKQPVYRGTSSGIDYDYDIAFAFPRELGVHVGTFGQANEIVLKSMDNDSYKFAERYLDDEVLDEIFTTTAPTEGIPVSLKKGYINVKNPLVVEADFGMWDALSIATDSKNRQDLLGAMEAHFKDTGEDVGFGVINKFLDDIGSYKFTDEYGSELLKGNESFRGDIVKANINKQLRNILNKVYGFDSIKYKNTGEKAYKDVEDYSYILFEPQQFKNVNATSFDPDDPRELFSAGGLNSRQKYGGGGLLLKALAKHFAKNIPDEEVARNVMPAPQRFFDPKSKEFKPFIGDMGEQPGGRYLQMGEGSPKDITGEYPEQAVIGVTSEGKPVMKVSKNLLEGETATEGRKIKTNLFKKKAGWKWTEAPEGFDPNPPSNFPLVSVEDGKQHYYTLRTEFPKGVELSRYEKSASEPRLRPTKKGKVYLGDKVGEISVRGKSHPVYDQIKVLGAAGAAVGAALQEEDSREALSVGGFLEKQFEKLLNKGAAMRGLNGRDLREHEKEVATFLNAAIDRGEIPEDFRVPTDEAGFGDFSAPFNNEVWNVANHAYLSYKHGDSFINRALLQGKELGQALFRDDAKTETTDMINNAYGFSLRDLADDELDAQRMIIQSFHDVKNKLQRGEHLKYGVDPIYNVNETKEVIMRNPMFTKYGRSGL